jgi:hypothetical protein
MSRPLGRLITLVSLASVVSLGAGANAFGADRIPVSSVDDASLSLVNRIGAVDDVVVAMDGRLGRILAALPEGYPPSPIFESLTGARSSLGTLIATIDTQLCNTDGVIGSGDASLVDGDVYASDVTATGLTNQLGSVRAVLAEANGRLVRIAGAYPAGPPVREVQAALTGVRASAAAGFEAITDRLGDAIHPPSPCFSA